MGWKVAWSDRMVFMYTSMFFLGIVWWFSRHQLKKLPWWGLVLFILPLAIDGATHTLSDLHGLGQGFRDSNVWLVNLTNNTFPISFYAGNAWDSFNDLARIVTGTLFGMGVVWFGFPYIEDAISDIIQGMQSKWYSSGFKSNNPSSVITENTHVRK